MQQYGRNFFVLLKHDLRISRLQKSDTRDGLVFVTKLCVTPLRQVPPTSKCASHAQAAPAQMLALSA
jgi:hypothetical protein